MQTIDTGHRCCPKCQGTTFQRADKAEDRSKLCGSRIECTNCGWHGYVLQLEAVTLPPVMEHAGPFVEELAKKSAKADK